MIRFSVLLILLSIILTSCYNDSEDGLFPMEAIDGSKCDSSVYTYSAVIKPMIDANCISCHSGGGTVLKTYNDISSQANLIYSTITHASGYQAMPQGSSKLDDCTIKQFEKWMKAGKPNN